MKTVKFYTLGCKVNLYETEAMKGLFLAKGYQTTEEDAADVLVINTCTVTAVGDKKSRRMIHRARNHNPHAVVAVVGCYAQASPEEVRALPEVDIILGTVDRGRIADLVEDFDGYRIDALQERIDAIYEDMPSVMQSRTRAMIKIQDGCSCRCSYCIIPAARGPIRSRPVDSIVSEAARLGDQGFSEAVLVGIHLSSYGRDLGLTLLDAVAAVCAVPAIQRVRLGSLEPRILTERFVAGLAALPKVCPSFHVSMQSGCDATLARMRRGYRSAGYLSALERLRRAIPGCAISTDVMTGFPGETDEEFLQSCETVKKAGFADLHVFPFSPRRNTPAAVMEGQVSERVKALRAKEMAVLGNKSRERFCRAQLGQTADVLFEKQSGESFEGFTPHYVKAAAKGAGLAGAYRRVLLQEYKDGICHGLIVD